jgi:hypothetical protein
VLDFEGGQVHNRDVHYDGLDALATNPAVTRIDHEGTAAELYRITGC